MNVLYEKLANKIREEFVLTNDNQDIIEKTSTATFDEFLRVCPATHFLLYITAPTSPSPLVNTIIEVT